MKNKYISQNLVKCILCNGVMKKLLVGYDYLYKTTKKQFNVYKCLSCKFEQIIPMPNRAELMSFYPSRYYSYNTSSKNKRKKSFFVKIRETLIELSYNSHVDKDMYYVLALLIRPFFQGLPLQYMGERKFLDVGCGDGYNVNLMSHLGWKAYGYEIGDKRILGNIYYDIDFSKVNFNDTKFDCIRVWHVLEHVPNPDQFIKKLTNILADNGKILIGIPNTASLAAVLFGQYWYGRDLPRHVVNYNPINLDNLFKKHGLRILRLSYNSAAGFLGSIQHIINSFFKSELNLTGNIFLFIIFFPIDMLSNFLKIGDSLSVVVEKNT